MFIQAILIFALGGIVGAILEKAYPTPDVSSKFFFSLASCSSRGGGGTSTQESWQN